MEALAVVGLVSSIVQFIDFSCKVVERLDDFHSAVKRAPKAFEGIRTELPLLLDTLQRTREQSENGHINKRSQEALIPVVDGCLQQVKLLYDILLRVLPAPEDSSWTRTRKALRSVRKESDVQNISTILGSYVQKLTHFEATGHTAQLNLVIRQHAKSEDAGVSAGHFLIPTLAVSCYVDRIALMQELENTFAPRQRDNSQVAVLIGMGGQGKSQLTLRFCQASRTSNRFEAIFWIDATSNSTLEASIATVAITLGGPESLDTFSAQLGFVKTSLEHRRSPWLLVFDNYDRPDLTLNISTCFPQSQFGHIIVTSRHAASKRLGSHIYVAGMSLNESLELLFARCELERTDSNSQEGKAVVDQLGHHPLAIDQAGTFINSKGLSMSGFLSQYKDKKARILQYTPALSEYRKKLNTSDAETALNVFTTLELSLQAVPGDDVHHAAVEDFLTTAAFFNGANIGEDLFRAGESGNQTWLQLFENDGWSHDMFEDTTEMLSQLSLIHGVMSNKLTYFSLHPLVTDWLKLRRDFASCKAFTLLSGSLVQACVDAVDYDGLLLEESRHYLITHLSSCLDNQSMYLVESDYDAPELLHQLHSFATILYRSGHLKKAATLYERALAGKEKTLGPDHISTLNTVNNLGSLYSDQGRLAEAEQMLERVLAENEKALGPENTSTLGTVVNLGILYKNQGRLNDAEQMYERALAGYEETLGPEHISTLNAINNLGSLYKDQGRLDEAEQMFERALAGNEKALGPEHTSTLDTVNSLGLVYYGQWRLSAAEKMYERALTGYDKALGPNHISTLSAINNLGSLYKDQGRLDDAEQMYERALAGKETALGLEHTSTLDTVNNLGLLYFNEGRRAKAEQMYERALAGYDKAGLGDNIPACNTKYNYGLLLRLQGKLEVAEDMFEQAFAGYSKTVGPQYAPAIESGERLKEVQHARQLSETSI